MGVNRDPRPEIYTKLAKLGFSRSKLRWVWEGYLDYETVLNDRVISVNASRGRRLDRAHAHLHGLVYEPIVWFADAEELELAVIFLSLLPLERSWWP